LVNAPANYEEKLGEVPEGVSFVESRAEPVDFIYVFVRDRGELEKNLKGLKRLLKPKGLIWVSYPKGSSGVKTDINRDSIWAYARTVGVEAVSQVSVDDTWSAMRLKVVES
jgi:hypothetical protein